MLSIDLCLTSGIEVPTLAVQNTSALINKEEKKIDELMNQIRFCSNNVLTNFPHRITYYCMDIEL